MLEAMQQRSEELANVTLPPAGRGQEMINKSQGAIPKQRDKTPGASKDLAKPRGRS